MLQREQYASCSHARGLPCYCPHHDLKDGKGNIFTGMCPFNSGGGTSVLFGGIPVPGGVPQDWDTPPIQYPHGQDSRVSTCYVVGGMPLAVSRRDFLV